MRDWEIVFTKSFKTFRNLVWIEIFCIKRKNITIKIDFWMAFRIKKIIIYFKRITWNCFKVYVRSYLSFFRELVFKEGTKSYFTDNFYATFILFNTGLYRSVRKCILRNFAKPIGKHPGLSLFLNKFAGFWLATLLKMSLWHMRSSLNPAKSPRISSPSSFWALCVFFFELNLLNQDTKIRVIMLCNFVMQFCYVTLFWLTYKNCL